ncbi:hypothetical protein X946_4717 [Burkholderia sp. ABCPW 111]|nr:hypothetical protein X946_4717 [Burkholderia sp. ABCPW 111]
MVTNLAKIHFCGDENRCLTSTCRQIAIYVCAAPPDDFRQRGRIPCPSRHARNPGAWVKDCHY